MSRHTFKLISALLLTVATCGLSCRMNAQASADIYSNEFGALIDSLTSTNQNEKLFPILVDAGDKAMDDNAFKVANNYYSKALACANALNNNEDQTDCLIKMSKANYGREFYGTAIRQLEQAENLARDNRMQDKLLEITEAQWRLFDNIGDIGNAYKYFKLNTEIKQQNFEQKYNELAKRIEAQDTTITVTPEKGDKKKKVETVRMVKQIDIPNMPLIIIIIVLLSSTAVLIVMNIVDKRKNASKIAAVMRNDSIKELIAPQYSRVAERLRDDAIELQKSCKKSEQVLRNQLSKLITDSQQAALMSDNMAVVFANRNAEQGEEKSVVDFDAILKSCVQHYENEAAEKGITISYMSTGKQPIECHARLAALTLDNMLSNAVKYSDKGDKISLWIETVDGSATIAVEDRGNGMDASKAKDIAEGRPVEQSAGTAGENGLGIGIEVCREAIRINGGKLIITGSPEGTTTGIKLRIK